MIVLSITMTWLTLTAAGFAALMALGRVQARSDIATDLAPFEHETTFIADRPSIGRRPTGPQVAPQ